MPKQSHTIFSVLRRGGVLPRPREGQSPSPTHFLNASVGADDPVRPRQTSCELSLRGRTAPVAIRNIPYLTPPVFRPPGRVLYSTARVSGT